MRKSNYYKRHEAAKKSNHNPADVRSLDNDSSLRPAPAVTPAPYWASLIFIVVCLALAAGASQKQP